MTITSRELIPCWPLRRYVQLIWLFESEADDGALPPERIVPDGIVELVLHYRRPMAIRFAGQRFELQPASSLVSQASKFVEIAPQSSTGLVSVRFYPWGGYHFFRQPVSEIANQCVPAAEIWGRDILRLEDRLAQAISSADRIRLVESFLLGQLLQHGKPETQGLLRGFRHSPADQQIRDFCKQAGVSERTFERRCRAALGMSPKEYRRLARFLRACSRLRSDTPGSMTEVAQACGYFDQAHFNHDFKALAGLTPGQFRSSRQVSHLDLD